MFPGDQFNCNLKLQVMAMLEFIYGGLTTNITDRVVEVLQIAAKYDIKPLKSFCISRISTTINISNLTTVAQLADSYSLSSLMAVNN